MLKSTLLQSTLLQSTLLQSVLAVCVLLLMLTEPAGAQEDGSHAPRRARAVEAAEGRLELQQAQGDDARALAAAFVQLGDAQLRSGQSAAAVKSFEQALALEPQSEPYLWQYGIALYFVGRYAEGRELFEKHRKVNPHDVENAAWHFLCAAKATDLAQARQLLLPAPADRRAPMKQILERLPGGDAEAIETAVAELQGSPAHASARLYADLYLGLIADAEGQTQTAERYLQQAASTELTNYMADVARVYAAHLESAAQR